MTLEDVQKLSDDGLRCAVASLLGWKWRKNKWWITRVLFGETAVFPPGCNNWWTSLGPRAIPDYPHDLNAMHEAEKALTYEQACTYANILDCLWKHGDIKTYADVCRYHVSARMRAEGYVHVLGNWEEQQ